MNEQPPLRERKRRRSQEAIVDAAFALFAERGFVDVTVTEIAERAEVGRTTFFRYFGDKQEALFADEQEMAEQLHELSTELGEKRPTFREALDQSRAAVETICDRVTANTQRYRLHEQLVADNPELHDRSERKLLYLTETMAATLRAQGTQHEEAALAAHLALACYRAGKATAGNDPGELKRAVDEAFELMLRAT